MARYKVLSPVRATGKTVKPQEGKTVYVTLDEEDAAELVEMGALAEAPARPTKKTAGKVDDSKEGDS